MHSEFIKETKLPEITEEQSDADLLDNIVKVKNNLQGIYNNLRYAESDLIDYYAYKIKAEEAKYGYLLKQAKKRDLKF